MQFILKVFFRFCFDQSLFRYRFPDLINLAGEDGSNAKGEMIASADEEPPGTPSL